MVVKSNLPVLHVHPGYQGVHLIRQVHEVQVHQALHYHQEVQVDHGIQGILGVRQVQQILRLNRRSCCHFSYS